MVRFVCCCANIRIHCQHARALPARTCFKSDDPFLKNEPLAATLDIAGVTMEIPFLCQVRPVEEWLITRCVNCGIDTHAISNNNHMNSVLISKEMESDPAKQDIITHNPNYSQAFKIVLNCNNSDDKLNGNNCVLVNDTSTLEYSNCLNRKSAELLKKEHASMVERISRYTAEQHAEYAKLQSDIHDEQQFILRRIMELKKRTGQPAEQESTIVTTNLTKTNEVPPKIAEPMRKLSDSEHVPPNDDAKPEFRRDFPPKRTDRKKTLRTFAQRKHHILGHGLLAGEVGFNLSRSLDMNAIFPMDELESSSEEDFEDDDAESEDEVEELSQTNSTTSASSHSLYATSLPVAMPGRKKRPMTHQITHTNNFDLESDSESDPFRTTNPEEIAASIQALAKSVHGNDGTEMFGGLPRPRLNTLG